MNADTAKLYYRFGNVFRDHVDFDNAIAAYTEAIKHKPDYAEAYYNSGKLYVEEDEQDKAIADFSKALQLIPCMWMHTGIVRICISLRVSMIKRLKIIV